MENKSNKKERTKEEQAIEMQNARFQITVIAVFYIVLGLLLLGNIASLWPSSTDAATCGRAVFFFQTLTISSEVRLILIVIMTGALGSLVHGYRSLFWYVGKRKYERSWTLMYLLLPLVGSSLSLLFYFVLRGGLFSPDATIDATSPFGFAGLSGLVGMFSNKAADKLKDIADSIFSTKPPDEDENKAENKEETEGAKK
jgi:hypothetical protein